MRVGNSNVSKNLSKILGNGTKEFVKNVRRVHQETGIAETSIFNWIAGVRNPQYGLLKKVANFFNIDTDSFYMEEFPIGKKELIEKVKALNSPSSIGAINTLLDILLEKERIIDKKTLENGDTV